MEIKDEFDKEFEQFEKDPALNELFAMLKKLPKEVRTIANIPRYKAALIAAKKIKQLCDEDGYNATYEAKFDDLLQTNFVFVVRTDFLGIRDIATFREIVQEVDTISFDILTTDQMEIRFSFKNARTVF